MSLLLLFRGGAAGVNATISSGQAQGATATAQASRSASVASGQAQGVSATAQASLVATIATGQAQGATATASGAPTVNATVSSAQAQGASIAAQTGINAAVASGQAQGVSATAVRALQATASSGQSQGATATGQRSIETVVSTGQAQTALLTGAVAGTIDATVSSGQAQSALFTVSAVAPSNPAAGKRRILLDIRGRIEEFETQADADKYLADLEPKEAKSIEAKAQRIAKAVVRTGNAFTPAPLQQVRVIQGDESLQALVNMRNALQQSALNDYVAMQIQREQLLKAQQDAEDLASVAALMMMM